MFTGRLRATSALLDKSDIEHGFTGKKNAADVARVAPHHVTQVHGTKLIEASDLTVYDSSNRPQGDGIFSLDGETVAVKTADCLPVLMASTHGKMVTAIHAGWRGFTAGILLNAVAEARRHLAINSFRFVIGPAISREAFEVGPEVVDAIQNADCGMSHESWALAVSKGQKDRWHVDLSTAAAIQLILAGVDPAHIEVIQACTMTDKSNDTPNWNSFRRDGKGCGSNWAWVRGK